MHQILAKKFKVMQQQEIKLATRDSKDKCKKFWDNSLYPLLQGIFWIVDGQYDPAVQNTSLLLWISAQASAPPQV